MASFQFPSLGGRGKMGKDFHPHLCPPPSRGRRLFLKKLGSPALWAR